MIPFIEMSRIGKCIETEGRLVVTAGLGSDRLMGMGFSLGMMEVFWN